MTETKPITINTMHDFAEPKQWVTLPLYEQFESYVIVIDANGEKIKISTKKD